MANSKLAAIEAAAHTTRIASRVAMLGIAAIVSLAFSASTTAAEHVVQMLNQGPGGTMVFEPAYLKVDVGDTVVFQPTQRGGHNSKSAYVPDGATEWTSPPDTEYKVEMSVEGVYVYVCQPHLVMGMSGVIQVGEATNLEAAKAAATTAAAGFAMNKDRLTTALSQIQ